MINPPINLDYNATAPLELLVQNVISSVLSQMGGCVGNPSSTHQVGRKAKSLIETARSEIAAILCVEPKSIVFTSGATEANATVINGFDGPVLVSSVEHSSILDARSNITFAPVDENGVVLLDFIDGWLSKQSAPSLVSVMAANNETGVIQPVKAIYDLCQGRDAFFHSDVVQAIGRIPLDLSFFDCVTMSGHKIGGLTGIGCLVMKETFPLKAMLKGGGQERSFRAGTENLLGIISFATALRNAVSAQRAQDWKITENYRDGMEQALMTFCPDVIIMGKDVPRLGNTMCITMPGLKAETQVMRFDLEGIAVSAGAACSSGKIKKSRVLSAMNVNDTIAETVLRVSLPPNINEKDIESFVSTWKNIYMSINQKHDSLKIPAITAA